MDGDQREDPPHLVGLLVAQLLPDLHLLVVAAGSQEVALKLRLHHLVKSPKAFHLGDVDSEGRHAKTMTLIHQKLKQKRKKEKTRKEPGQNRKKSMTILNIEAIVRLALVQE